METRDIVDIQQLMSLYGHAVDADLSLLTEVFTEDAVFDVQLTGWGLIQGREAITAWFALGKPPHPPSHHVTNIHVYEAHGKTLARSKWLYIDRLTGKNVSGDYNDVVIRTTAGWRISHRSLVIRYPENYPPKLPAPQATSATA